MLESGNKDILYIKWYQFKDGDKEAFAFFYNLHIDRLFRYGLKFCKDEDTIKDAIQEVFLDLYIKRNKNNSNPENLKYYLLLALKRILIKRLQKNRRFDSSDTIIEKNDGVEFSIEYQLIEQEQDTETRNKILNALNLLPEKQKEAIYLRFNEAMKYEEIAAILDISIESVRKQVYRALKTVRELLNNKSVTILFNLFVKKS